jgi:hypothetical protein
MVPVLAAGAVTVNWNVVGLVLPVEEELLPPHPARIKVRKHNDGKRNLLRTSMARCS